MAKRGTHKPRKYTNRVQTNITLELFDWAMKEAEAQDISLAQLLRVALTEYLEYSYMGELTN